MCMQKSGIHMGFSQGHFAPGTHICLVFRDEAERKSIVSRFIEAGIAEQERVFYFADSAKPGEVRDWLGALDVDTDTALTGGCLSIDEAADTYCPDGAFVPDRMLDTLRSAYTGSREAGYPGSRVSGEMTWALRGFPGSDRLMQYEAAVNRVVQSHPITAMCQYDANRFSGSTIFRALQVHPYMVMHGQLVKNPYYLEGA